MATISDLRLITLLPTENQTIYVFNTDNPNEYYTESFFAKMGTTWAFCVVPDRIDNSQDYYVNIIQSDNQTIVLDAIIPDIAIEPELRAGILNYYNSNSNDRYTYTIGYQDIRVFTTAVLKERQDIEYKYIEPIQVEHQLILIVDSANKAYSYGVELPLNSFWKAVLIVEPGYTPGNLIYYRSGIEDPEITEVEFGEIIKSFVSKDLIVTATEAKEVYNTSTIKPWLFDNSTTDYSNCDDYITIGVGTETKKEVKNILLYSKTKISIHPSVQLGVDPDNMLYAATGSEDHDKATRLIYRTESQKRFILSAMPGFYDYDYILGYSNAIKDSSMTPKEFNSGMSRVTIKSFGFCAEKSPVNDLTKGYWFMTIDPPTTDNWTYIKIMIFDETKKIFSMVAYKDYFEEIEEGQFIGELMYVQGSKNGINDDAYLFLKNKFDNRENVITGVYIY